MARTNPDKAKKCWTFTPENGVSKASSMTYNHFNAAMVTIIDGAEVGLLIAGGMNPRTGQSEFHQAINGNFNWTEVATLPPRVSKRPILKSFYFAPIMVGFWKPLLCNSVKWLYFRACQWTILRRKRRRMYLAGSMDKNGQIQVRWVCVEQPYFRQSDFSDNLIFRRS